MLQNKSIDRLTIQHYWHVGLRYKSDFVLSLLSPIGTICFNTIIPFYIGKILAQLGRNGYQPGHYLPYLIIVAFVGLLANRIGFKRLLTWQAKCMSCLQTESLEVLLKRSVGFHNDNVSGKLVSDAIDYPAAFSQLSNTFFTSIVPFAVTIVSGIFLILVNSVQLGGLMLLMTAYTVGSSIRQSQKRAPLRTERQAARKAVIANLADTITNTQTVKTFAKESFEMNRNKVLENELLRRRIHSWQLVATDGNNRIAVVLAFEVAFIWLLIHLVQHNPAVLAIGIFAFSYTITLTNRLFEINNMIRSIEDSLLDAYPMTEILQETPEISDRPNASRLHIKKGQIDFRQVDFQYDKSVGQDAVFEGLNLSIQPGEKIGLVGSSGGGKSTFTRLLLRFEDIQSGEISIDGQNIAEVTQASLREAISYVPQEPLLFHRTISENISYGLPHASADDIAETAKNAYALDFITALPQGFDTTVGERGVKLSGGQRQRVAIARAMLKNAPILVLDEATSALDSESEVLIQDALWKLMEGRTAIVIAHRLSTIQKMDRIIVLEDGKIVEEGSHKELLRHGGTYAKLWAHQSGGFLEE